MSEQRLLLLTDSASDIPDEDLARYPIRMLSIPIAVDGVPHQEREDLSIGEFPAILRAAREIPVTSHIPAGRYEQVYLESMEAGYTHLINVTINSTGSNMYHSSIMGAKLFYENHPEARKKLQIYVVDSHTYAMVYGWAVVEAARKAEAGADVRDILAFLEAHFSTSEIYLGLYSLQFAKKSGRISAAAAFMGELMGLRPIMTLIDGKNETLEKPRGSRLIPQRLVELALARREDPDSPVLVLYGEDPEPAREAAALIREQTGKEPPVYPLGPSIVINSGPEILGVAVNGPRRRLVDPDFGRI